MPIAHSALGHFEDRRHLANIAQRCSASNLLVFLEVCIGKEYHRPCSPDALSLGVLGRARLKCLENLATIQYLLLESGDHDRPLRPTSMPRLDSVKITLTGPRKHALMAKILDFLASEVSTLFNGVKTSLKLTADTVNAMITLCIISYSFSADQYARKVRKYDELQQWTRELLTSLVGSIRQGGGQASISEGFFDPFAKVLPGVTDLLAKKNLLSQGLVDLLRAVDADLWFNFCGNEDYNRLAVEEDEIKSGSEFELQEGSFRPKPNGVEESCSGTVIASDATSFRSSLAVKLFYISSTRDFPDEPQSNPNITAQFAHSMVSLPPSRFVCCQHFLRELFGPETIIGVEEATVLLRYLGQELLRSYTLERSETAMGLALDIMTGLVDLWTTTDNFEVSEAATDIYDWFITIALERRLASSHVLVRMSILLQRLIRTSPDYGNNMGLPSARTNLFRVLDDGTLDVKFSVGNNISDIFGLFVLNKHEDILGDVIKILPNAADWPDGIALRLYVLSRLAQSWPTLLRRCVYAIYETPAIVPISAGHAEWCLKEVSQSLQLQDSRELFRLFAPQILYTWLETHILSSIPFSIFGYQTLRELIADAQDELAGQIVMRHREEEEAHLAREIGKSFGQILDESIGKVTGYAIAQDVAVSASKNTHTPSAEARLRKTLGKERYTSRVTARLHDVLLNLFKSIDEDKSIEKAFQSGTAYKDIQTTFHKIKSISASVEVLPVGQQPSFAARFILDEIAYVCRRTGQQPETVWSPSLYVYLFRGLLDTLHPALGSQHACSTIRKLRILVTIAGSTALESYPLEMALHSLRPFLTDIHCSEDSIGIFQYLLMAGKPCLKSVPTFVIGLGIVSLISLKSFLGSSQESTTQESQHRATMTRASSFHGWLGTYMSDYDSATLPADSALSFKRMIEAARNVRANGNAHRGSHESDLLVEVLDNITSGRKLLNGPSQELILRQLCADFARPSNFREDIFGLDSEAADYAPVLWRLIQNHDYGEKFHLWVGTVLGRAYASTGEASKRMTLEASRDRSYSTLDEHQQSIPITSESCVLKTLGTMLLLDDRRQVGIVEQTLRSIISQAEGTDLFVECEQTLPSSVTIGLLWRHYHLPELGASTRPQKNVEDVAASFRKLKAQEWVQQLCLALAAKAKDDVLLSALPYLLCRIDSICNALFPFVVHLTLLREINGEQVVRRILSTTCRNILDETADKYISHTRLLLRTIVYLREQPYPQEVTKSDRCQWLDIDYNQAASAAVRCSMFKTALLFLDISFSRAVKASRRVSAVKIEEPTELLLQIYKNIDEQDAFYGVEQPSSLASMMTRLEYEHAGFKSLSFRGAHYDSQIKLAASTVQTDEEGMVQALETLDLNGLSQSLLGRMTNLSPVSLRTMLNTARKLEQWDLSAPVAHANTASSVFRAFQGISNAQHAEVFSSVVDVAMSETMDILRSGDVAHSSIHQTLGTLAVLTEIDELCSVRDFEQLEDVWLRFEEREEWMHTER